MVIREYCDPECCDFFVDLVSVNSLSRFSLLMYDVLLKNFLPLLSRLKITDFDLPAIGEDLKTAMINLGFPHKIESSKASNFEGCSGTGSGNLCGTHSRNSKNPLGPYYKNSYLSNEFNLKKAADPALHTVIFMGDTQWSAPTKQQWGQSSSVTTGQNKNGGWSNAEIVNAFDLMTSADENDHSSNVFADPESENNPSKQASSIILDTLTPYYPGSNMPEKHNNFDPDDFRQGTAGTCCSNSQDLSYDKSVYNNKNPPPGPEVPKTFSHSPSFQWQQKFDRIITNVLDADFSASLTGDEKLMLASELQMYKLEVDPHSAETAKRFWGSQSGDGGASKNSGWNWFQGDGPFTDNKYKFHKPLKMEVAWTWKNDKELSTYP